jgi:hypothetical protein
LRGLFLIRLLERRSGGEDPVCYENFAFNNNLAEVISFGTTIVYPGKVGLD